MKYSCSTNAITSIKNQDLFNQIFGRSSSKLSFKNKRGVVIFSLFILIVLALLLVTLNGWFDKSSMQGQYIGKTDEEIRRALDINVEEGMMNVSIANTIKFNNGSQNPGIARIENLAANHVDQKVTLILDDTNEVIYESGAIAPDFCINEIILDKYLEPGIYKATAIFKGYEREWPHSEAGAIAAQINIEVD